LTLAKIRSITVACLSAVGTHNIPESVRVLSLLPDIDYADQFTLATDVDATPEQWARAMFGDVPSVAELLIWRGLLGLRLSRGRSPATVAGWQIGERGDDWIRLEAASWFLTGNLLVQTPDGRVSLATSCTMTGAWAMVCGPRCPPSNAAWYPGCSATPRRGFEHPDEETDTRRGKCERRLRNSS
jgi:hypothetical protein